MRRNIIFTSLILIALASFYMAYQMNEFYVFGSYANMYTYGGDAFTGIQNASAQTANNVFYQSHLLKKFFTYFFSLIGICSSLGCLVYVPIPSTAFRNMFRDIKAFFKRSEIIGVITTFAVIIAICFIIPYFN